MNLVSCVTSQSYLNNILNNYSNSIYKIYVFVNKKDITSNNKKIMTIYINSNLDDHSFTREIKINILNYYSKIPFIYFDSSVIIRNDFTINFNNPICWFSHQKRSNAVSEVLYNILNEKNNIIDFLILIKEIIKKKTIGNLVFGGVFVVNNKKAYVELKKWYELYKYLGGKRDQLSLSLVDKECVKKLPKKIIIGRNKFTPPSYMRFFIKLRNATYMQMRFHLESMLCGCYVFFLNLRDTT